MLPCVVVGVIATIVVAISNQESKTLDEGDSTDSGQNMAQIDNQSHNVKESKTPDEVGKYYYSKNIS